MDEPGAAAGRGGVAVEVTRHALDRAPLSLIIDDSTPLVNLNYFFLRDRIAHTGQQQRWEDVPVVIPESFTREFAEWCLAQGVRGKYSVVPCPAGLGRIDRGLPPFSQAQLASWLAMCRETITPAFDITPELLSHTFVLDLESLRPLPSRIWEQYEWSSFTEEEADLVRDYMTLACQILVNVGLPPEGITSPGGFGGQALPLYARLTGEALRQTTGDPTPYFFQRIQREGRVETPVWHADPERGAAVGEVIAAIGDWTGSWTGYGEVDADRYITADLQGGRLPAVIDAGDPCILISHWQGFYGLHNDDRRGFRALQQVVERLRARDPHGERTQWRKPSEIARYACARAMARIAVEEPSDKPVAAGEPEVVRIRLDLPVLTPDLTLRATGARGAPLGAVREVRCDGAPLRRASTRRAFGPGAWWLDGDALLLAYQPRARGSEVEIRGTRD